MQNRNHVSTYTPAYKGLFEYLSDQLMAQLVNQETPQGTGEGPEVTQPVSEERPEASTSAYVTNPKSGVIRAGVATTDAADPAV